MKKQQSTDLTGTPLDRFKFCPHCGSSDFKKGDSNCLLCPTCGFTYYVNPPVSVVALINDSQERLLLTQRKYDPAKGKFDFPGGFVDMHETLEEALKREIREELNLEISHMDYYNSFVTTYPFKGLIYYPVDTVFKCQIKDWNTLQIHDDVSDICFKSLQEISDEELAFASNRLLIKKLRNRPV